MTCLWTGCQRAAVADSPSGTRHAHCQQHEDQLLREAFGPVSWTQRAMSNTLPPLVVGGVPLDSPSCAEPSTVSPERSTRLRSRQGAKASEPVLTGSN
jgi:hypothetical protein